jgi:DNA polymerase III subunit delta
MEVNANQLAQRLKQGAPGLILLHGDEALLMLEAADQARNAFRAAGAQERQVFVVERHFDWSELTHRSGSMSLFATQQLIEVRLPKKPGVELGEPLAQWVETLSADVRVIISMPRLDKRLQNSAWMQRIDSASIKTWIVPIYSVDFDRLPQWIGQRLAAQDQRAEPRLLEFLAQRVEGHLLAAHQEIQKLALLCPPGLLDEAQVRAVVLDVARYDAYDLCDAMLEGDAARALRCLAGLQAEGLAVPLVLWAVAQALRNLAGLCRLLKQGEPWAQATRMVGLFAPRDKPYRAALERLRAQDWAAALQIALRDAAEVDRMSKGITHDSHLLDAWHGLERIVMRVAGVALPEPEALPH